ncbi:hypothetical protein CHS0354_040492 [Potamilus streckersoni]|uniref:Uncharacterized protein n=1 Tax=Potamilus streckersoni TaxID=2493646 RepID=A0AAE0WGK4_9BIVA|nr:hypothetical protein CHS0354_040492 [Potamilus streckersoni]
MDIHYTYNHETIQIILWPTFVLVSVLPYLEGNDRGLIITLTPSYSYDNIYIETVSITTDGAPDFDSRRTLNFSTKVLFLSVEGDYALRQSYMYEYYSGIIYRDSNFSIDFSGPNYWSIVHEGVSMGSVKLAVDWINHNIYWTDSQFKWIVVQSLASIDKSMYRILIHENLEGPHALTLDPMEGLLFWSDIGSFTKIEVSSLSGKNRKSLISSNLIMPISLAADYGARRIYWIDSGRYTLESITYEGKERKIFFKTSYNSFFDLAVYKDYLYVTNLEYQEVDFFNKMNGEKLEKSLIREGEIYLGVTVFHPEAQPTSVTAYCVNYGCEHICVTEKGGASCVCRDGYILNQDMKTCSDAVQCDLLSHRAADIY